MHVTFYRALKVCQIKSNKKLISPMRLMIPLIAFMSLTRGEYRTIGGRIMLVDGSFPGAPSNLPNNGSQERSESP